ncbi:MAG: CBS domain-containing protein [Ignavibacteriales bacterium]|nr:MAG: CBS domain-containing protein [Ignavibacteriales bacterium]
MKNIREILSGKDKNIYSINSSVRVYNALELMAEKDIGALLVMEDGNIKGILSERDYARKVILNGKSSKEMTVEEIMSEDVIYVTAERTVEECMALMTNKRVRHLPVMENDKLIGIISIGDVVKALIDEKEFVIEQLVHYIKGTPPIHSK